MAMSGRPASPFLLAVLALEAQAAGRSGPFTARAEDPGRLCPDGGRGADAQRTGTDHLGMDRAGADHPGPGRPGPQSARLGRSRHGSDRDPAFLRRR